jgi:hypothetical protein
MFVFVDTGASVNKALSTFAYNGIGVNFEAFQNGYLP